MSQSPPIPVPPGSPAWDIAFTRLACAARPRVDDCTRGLARRFQAIGLGSETQVRQTPRGLSTFLPIADYPYAHWRARRPRGERIVELAVEPGLPDVARLVRRVVLMRGAAILDVLHEADPP